MRKSKKTVGLEAWLALAAVGLATWGCGEAPPPRPNEPDGTPQCSERSIRCWVGPAEYDKWSSAMTERARSAGVTIGPGDVDHSILLLLSEGTAQFMKLGFGLPRGEDRKALFEQAGLPADGEVQAPEPPPPSGGGSRPPAPTRYYQVKAYHQRTKSDDNPERTMDAGFEEALPLVRVRLPDTDEEAQAIGHYYTNVGYVFLYPSLAGNGMKPGDTMGASGKPCLKLDHWYGSVAQVRRDLPGQLGGGDVKRVDLVTTGRINDSAVSKIGYRFSAIGFYLGYTNVDDKEPSFYVVEAGEALNYARQVFFARGRASDSTSPTGDGVATGLSTYNPTRLSDPMNRYKSWLQGALDTETPPVWEPTRLTIRAAHPVAGDNVTAANAYITVTANMARDHDLESTPESPTKASGPTHWELLCRAVAHVREMHRAMGGTVVLPAVPDDAFAKLCRSGDTPVVVRQYPDVGIPHVGLPYDAGTCK
jgi:hypothetical protein